MPTQKEIDAFSERVEQRDRERMKIVGFTVTVNPINDIDQGLLSPDVTSQQPKLPEVPNGQS